MTYKLNNRCRAQRVASAIIQYDEDLPESNLVDLLTDAMHWCDQSGFAFPTALSQAGRHYINELNDQQHDEGRIS